MLNKELNVTQRTLALTGSGSSLQKGLPRNQFSNYSQGENNMAYSPKQEQALQNAAPITSSSAELFAAEFGVSKRSVISKAVTLKIYQKDAPRARSAAKPTKADIVAEIGEALNAGDLSGLEGATMRSLYALLESIG
jgi:uncharacterized glyoxalase superfamily metalloenzyme YdcJ